MQAFCLSQHFLNMQKSIKSGFLKFIILSNFYLVSFNTQSQPSNSKQNQVTIKTSTISKSTIIGGDQTNNNYFIDLDSLTTVKIDSFFLEIRAISLQIAKLDDKLDLGNQYEDSILKLTRELSKYQRLISHLQKMKDSSLSIKSTQELYMKRLLKEYNDLLFENFGDFWAKYPNFNPTNNKQFVEMLELLQDIHYANIPVRSSWHHGEFEKCNACIRKYPNEWKGIIIDGIHYEFGTWTFSSINIHIPNHGPINLIQLIQKYRSYWDLINNKADYVDRPFEQFKLFSKVPGCISDRGKITVENRLKENIYVDFKTPDQNGYMDVQKESINSVSNYNIAHYEFKVYNQHTHTLIRSGSFDLFGCTEITIIID